MRDYIVLSNRARLSTAAPSDKGLTLAAFGAGVQAEPQAPGLDMLRGASAREVADVARAPEVVAIAPSMRVALIQPLEVAAAAAAGDAWGIAAVGADTSTGDGGGALPAVLDTGIDATHPAFAGVVLEQRDFTGFGNGDQHGHGTHCAGTIFGRDVDGHRIGIARGVTRALIGRVLGADGGGTSEAIFQALQWTAERGANVVSMSLGFDFPGMVENIAAQGVPRLAATSIGLEAYRANLRMFDALMAMVQARLAFGAGTVVVAAAGNESGRNKMPPFEVAASLPAAAEHVVSVAALGQSPAGLTVAPFSNIYPQLAAPGVNILSARLGGGLVTMSGTSMACPHVAGVACLWWQALTAGGEVPSARSVMARLHATARTQGLAPGSDKADRGEGVVTAPP